MKRILLFGLMAAVLATAETPQESYQKALVKERSEGRLDEAMQLYRRAADSAGKDRALAAKALMQLAACYEKLGNTESRKIYDRVVREYADQKDAVAMARERLGAGVQVKSVGVSARQVWTIPPELNADPEGTVSLDGRYIAYVNWAQYGDLFLHDLATGADRRLTNTATDGIPGKPDEFAEELAISRDGRQLAYTWFTEQKQRAELRVIDLQASGISQPRVLYGDDNTRWIYPEDWSLDGKSIAVQITRKDRTAVIGFISIADGSLRVLKSIDWRHSTKMFLSPDGRYLAYDSAATQDAAQRDIFVIATDGSRETPAVVDEANDKVMGWSPDGRHLLFARDRGGSSDLWALTMSDGKPAGPPERIRKDLGHVQSKGFSRSGAFYYDVFYRANQNRTDVRIATFDFASGRVLVTAAEPLPDFGGSSSQPAWSPDGKYLAYIAQAREDSNRDHTLVIRTTETGQFRTLHVKLDSFGSIRWSSDGRNLAVIGRDYKGRNGIFQVNAQNGEIAIIAEGNLIYPIWAPDGKRIYYERRTYGQLMTMVAKDLVTGSETEIFKRMRFGFRALSPDGSHLGIMASDNARAEPGEPMTLFLLPVAGGEARELIRRPSLGAVNFSPDGRYIATSSLDPSKKMRMVILIPTKGGSARDLMRVSEPNGFGVMMWAPDSSSVLLKTGSTTSEHTEIWRVPIDGSEARKIEMNADHIFAPFLASPDGRHVAYTMTTGTPLQAPAQPKKGELWMLENFLPALASK